MKRTTKPKAKPKKAVGAPSKYNEKLHPVLARTLASKGFNQREISDIFAVDEHTFINWCNKHPELRQALQEGKAEPDEAVTRAFLQRALGYTWNGEKALVVSDGSGRGSHVEKVRVEEHVPPDVTACFLWLKNRRPDEWSDKKKLEHSGTIYRVMTDDEEDESGE